MKKTRFLAVPAALGLLAFVPAAPAQTTLSWTNVVGDFWSGNNWTNNFGGAVPGAGG